MQIDNRKKKTRLAALTPCAGEHVGKGGVKGKGKRPKTFWASFLSDGHKSRPNTTREIKGKSNNIFGGSAQQAAGPPGQQRKPTGR